LVLALALAAHGVHMMVTGRPPFRSAKAERASQAKPQGASLLFLAFAMLAMALPRVLDWPDGWQIASSVLCFAFLAGMLVMRAKAKKAASSNSTESRDVHSTP